MREDNTINEDNSRVAAGSRARVMNLIGIVSLCLSLVSAFAGSDSTPYALSLVGLAGIFAVALLLFRFKQADAGIFWMTFATTVWICYMCVAFNSIGVEQYLVIPLVALSIFSPRKVYRTTVVVILIALIVVLHMYQRYYTPLFTAPRAADWLFAINMVTPLTIVVLMCRMVLGNIARSQKTIEAQKEELANSAAFKDKILSIIGHDMRTPFNSTKGMLELLDSDMMDETERRVMLQELHKTVDISLQTLDNILGWASQGYYASVLNTKTKIEPLDMHGLIDKAISFFRYTAGKKDVVLINQVTPDIFVSADLEQVTFVLRNLLGNALKFSYANSRIRIDAVSKDKMIAISVRDEGVGMSPEQIASLFRINTRFSIDGTTNEKGSGLGLIFCKEFIDNNKGEIWVESVQGKGTSVYFTLPVA